MNEKLDLIQMMNTKLDELTARGIPPFHAKLIVAQAMIITLEQSGISQSDIMKMAAIFAK